MNTSWGLSRVGWEPWSPTIGQMAPAVSPETAKDSNNGLNVPWAVVPLGVIAGIIIGYIVGVHVPFGGRS